MKLKYAIVALFMIIVLIPGSSLSAKGVTYKKFIHGRYVYDTVWVNMADPGVRLTIQVPGGFPLAGASFRTLVSSSRPSAAVTGTYFNMSSHVPVGDIVMFGQLIHFGGMGTAMAISDDNRVLFKRVPTGFVMHWNNFETVLAAGPTLLSKGRIDIHPEMEPFSDRRIYGSAIRCAVGWRDDNIVIFLTSRGRVSLQELANTFICMKCREAMNLDGGGSSALYCNGKTYKKPTRSLTNLLLVFDSRKRYDAYRKTSAYTFYRTGAKFRKKGKSFQAMLNFRGATAADPSNASYFRDLAGTYSALGWHLWESTALSKAAAIYDRKGNAEKACFYYEKSLKASDANADAHRWMAGYYEKTGDAGLYLVEKKALSRCLFASTALIQDLFASPQQNLWYKLSWDDSADGWLNEKTFGIKMKIPEDWEICCSCPYYMLLQNKDPQNPVFMSLEAIKTEVFASLDRTVQILREKRGGEVTSSENREVSGFPGGLEVTSGISIDGKPWKFTTAYAKRSRWVFVLTLAAPEEHFQETQTICGDVLTNFSLEHEFEPYL